MRHLLDTHVLLWYFNDSDELPDSIAEVMEDALVSKFISVASLWEFTIKHSLGKLDFADGVEMFWTMVIANGITVMQISKEHLNVLERLPLLHRDPFDRLLLATTIAEAMTILTSDKNIHQYDVSWAW